MTDHDHTKIADCDLCGQAVPLRGDLTMRPHLASNKDCRASNTTAHSRRIEPDKESRE